MSKIKFTKGELKRQRDLLKQFEHYLPILQLKKQQLHIEIQRVHERLDMKKDQISNLKSEINNWAGLLKEPGDFVSKWIKPKKILTTFLNIAGVNIPLLEGVDFEDTEYDLFLTPLWVDIAIERIRELVKLLEEERILNEQARILQEELRITTQRVNLFEKVKIPECRENARLIRVYLRDQETNAVCRSKIAKNKIEKLVLESVIA